MTEMIGKYLQRQQGRPTRGLENLKTWVLIPVVQAPGQLSPHLQRGDEGRGEDRIKSRRRRARQPARFHEYAGCNHL